MWDLAIQGGLSVLGGLLGRSSARRAARARQQAYAEAGNITNTAYDRAEGFYDPRLAQERSAMSGVNSLLGLGGEAPDYSLFRNMPGYQYALDEGQQAIQRSAAARGGLASGNTLLELQRHAQGMADQNFGNYLNTLLGLQGQGVDSALAGMSINRGNTLANYRLGAGGAQAQGYEDQTGALLGALSGVGRAVGGWQGGNSLGSYLKPQIPMQSVGPQSMWQQPTWAIR